MSWLFHSWSVQFFLLVSTKIKFWCTFPLVCLSDLTLWSKYINHLSCVIFRSGTCEILSGQVTFSLTALELGIVFTAVGFCGLFSAGRITLAERGYDANASSPDYGPPTDWLGVSIMALEIRNSAMDINWIADNAGSHLTSPISRPLLTKHCLLYRRELDLFFLSHIPQGNAEFWPLSFS